MGKKIRIRERRNASPPAGTRQAWDKVQVVESRKVIGRYDLITQALKAHPDAVPDQSCNPT